MTQKEENPSREEKMGMGIGRQERSEGHRESWVQRGKQKKGSQKTHKKRIFGIGFFLWTEREMRRREAKKPTGG